MNKTGGRKKIFITVSRCSAPSQHLLRPLFWGKSWSIYTGIAVSSRNSQKSAPPFKKREWGEESRKISSFKHFYKHLRASFRKGWEVGRVAPSIRILRVENHFRRMCTKKSTINYSVWEIPKSKSKIRHVSLWNFCCCSLPTTSRKIKRPFYSWCLKNVCTAGVLLFLKGEKSLNWKMYSTACTIWCKHSAVQLSVFRNMHLHDFMRLWL